MFERNLFVPVRTFLLCFITCSIVTPLALAAPNCDSIVAHGLRNIEVSQSAEAAVALRYFNHCQKNFSSMTDNQLVETEAEVFGYFKGSGDYSRQRREEDLQQWCTTNRDIAVSNKNSYAKSQTFYADAVRAWASCNALSAQKLSISPIIAPDARTVTMGIVYNGPSDGVLLYDIDSEGFICTSKFPDDKEVSFPFKVKNESVQVTCRRAAPETKIRNTTTYNVLSRGTISVRTASDPFQLYFPEEWDPELPDKVATELRNQLARNDLPVGSVLQSVLREKEFFDLGLTRFSGRVEDSFSALHFQSSSARS